MSAHQRNAGQALHDRVSIPGLREVPLGDGQPARSALPIMAFKDPDCWPNMRLRQWQMTKARRQARRERMSVYNPCNPFNTP